MPAERAVESQEGTETTVEEESVMALEEECVDSMEVECVEVVSEEEKIQDGAVEKFDDDDATASEAAPTDTELGEENNSMEIEDNKQDDNESTAETKKDDVDWKEHKKLGELFDAALGKLQEVRLLSTIVSIVSIIIKSALMILSTILRIAYRKYPPPS